MTTFDFQYLSDWSILSEMTPGNAWFSKAVNGEPLPLGTDEAELFTSWLLFLMPKQQCQSTQVATYIHEKPLGERRKHCALAVVKQSQTFSPRCRPPSWGHRMAKI